MQTEGTDTFAGKHITLLYDFYWLRSILASHSIELNVERRFVDGSFKRKVI